MALLKTVATAAALFSMVGCSVSLAPTIPSDFGGRHANGQLAANHTAQGMPRIIGHGTFSLFAISVADITITNGPGGQLVMDSIKQTLRSAGYSVIDVTQPRSTPVLECNVIYINFKNYTWGFPIVPTWGSMDVSIRLVDTTGNSKWARTYHGSSWNLTYSFDSAVNSSMEKILGQFAMDATDSSFQKACCEVVR